MLSEKLHSQSPITPTHFIESKWRHNRLICMSTKYKQSSLNIFRGVAFTNCHGRTETIKYYKTCRIGLNKKQTSWLTLAPFDLFFKINIQQVRFLTHFEPLIS